LVNLLHQNKEDEDNDDFGVFMKKS
jgi:hypothetical protein